MRDIAEGKVLGDLKTGFKIMVDQIWGDKSEYKDNDYKDFKNLIKFPDVLKNDYFKKIYKELDWYPFHGAKFDLFGVIYEEFASQKKKQEFGEFYTRRNITGMVSRLLLRNETSPSDLKICDPACGSGGFLTEAYKTLINNYSQIGKLNPDTETKLKTDIFWGYDNDEKSVARTKLNMFLVGDGHVHIYKTEDSLIGWNQKEFDYILTNPPIGTYKGEADIRNFDFTNEKRYELLFTEKIIKATKFGGEIATVINDGALEAPSRENFRKKLLQICNIYAIIILPKFEFAPYTKEKTYILFMQKKQEEEIGEIQIQKKSEGDIEKIFQKFPIWHFILDYDGYANSDKRYKTKYHDDIPELEEKFEDAIKLSRIYLSDRNRFEKRKS